MLTYFPRFFTSKAIACYFVSLALVSLIFMSHAMPFQFMLFGIVFVLMFFIYTSKLSMEWRRYSPTNFSKKLFLTALIIRIVYVIFIYFYYIQMTGEPHAFHKGDEGAYDKMGLVWAEQGFEAMRQSQSFESLSDRGYGWWLGFLYRLFGTNVLAGRIPKCFIDAFSCVLIYNLAKRSFGEFSGRMAGVFCMMMPNMWMYCGITLKETEMAFLIILFLERADLALRSRKIMLRNLLLPSAVILVMFTFRTPVGAVMVAAMAAALIFSSKKQLKTWQKILYSSVFAVWMILTVGVEIIQETQQLWETRVANQALGYEARAQRDEANTFIKYASASVFAPFMFTMPFSSMIAIANQENQMLIHGGNFIKNVMSGFTIYGLALLLFRGEWRKHVLTISMMCGYLVVVAFSNFAHSERFHFPVLALELMFAAYGISQVTNKQKRWYSIWLVVVSGMVFIWAWIKLAGRGLS